MDNQAKEIFFSISNVNSLYNVIQRTFYQQYNIDIDNNYLDDLKHGMQYIFQTAKPSKNMNLREYITKLNKTTYDNIISYIEQQIKTNNRAVNPTNPTNNNNPNNNILTTLTTLAYQDNIPKRRQCIARAIAVNPEIILMDEPCSALDPIATAIIEELIDELRLNYTIIIVTHSMQQAARVSQKTCFFHLGELIESGETNKIFTNPDNTKTQDYITGRFG